MNIFVLSQGYPNPGNIQSNIFVHEQCRMLMKMGHTVTVLDAGLVTWRKWFDDASMHIVHRQWDGVDVYTWNARAFATTYLRTMNQASYRKNALQIYEYVRRIKGNPDVIYAHFSEQAGYTACIIKRKYGVPVAVMEHGGSVMNNRHRAFFRRLLGNVTQNADDFMCVSQKQRACIERYVPDCREIKVFPNMVDDLFEYVPLRENECFTFFSAGNLVKVKRMDMLIRAFDMAFSAADNVRLRIAGDGAERGSLERLIRELKIEDRVTLLGRLDRAHMKHEYEKCNVFALASEHESFGIVYREALFVGRPVVATDNGGISEGWKDEYGYICPLDDVKAFADGMRAAYENYNEFDLPAISDDIKEYCSCGKVMNRIVNVLESVCK